MADLPLLIFWVWKVASLSTALLTWWAGLSVSSLSCQSKRWQWLIFRPLQRRIASVNKIGLSCKYLPIGNHPQLRKSGPIDKLADLSEHSRFICSEHFRFSLVATTNVNMFYVKWLYVTDHQKRAKINYAFCFMHLICSLRLYSAPLLLALTTITAASVLLQQLCISRLIAILLWLTIRKIISWTCGLCSFPFTLQLRTSLCWYFTQNGNKRLNFGYSLRKRQKVFWKMKFDAF